jgi:hypothetical protein
VRLAAQGRSLSAGGEPAIVHSLPLQTALTDFVQDAACHLQGEISQGAEVAFEVAAKPSRLHQTPLYCYSPLTAGFIKARAANLRKLASYPAALALVADAPGIERYLLSRGLDRARADARGRADSALFCLLDDVFNEQTDFEVHLDRMQEALALLQQSTVAGAADEVTVLATLHGLALGSTELALTAGLLLAQPEAMPGAPEEAVLGEHGQQHLIVAFSTDTEGHDINDAVAQGRGVLRDLLRALRLFGDGRVTLGELAWTRMGNGSWRPITVGCGGRPRGVLLITAEQEDELRAFCNLVSRRAPHSNELAWALNRFEMGCQRASEHEALSDYLLALRALLEPEGTSSGLLAGRLAALCAKPDQRGKLAKRVTEAVALERAVIAGSAKQCAATEHLVKATADHLRALLRDVICGHLDPDLALLADELLAPEQEPADEDLDQSQPDVYEQIFQTDHAEAQSLSQAALWAYDDAESAPVGS